MFKKVITIVLLLLIGTFSTSSFAQYDLSQKIPLDPTVKIGQLPNGLRYYIQKNNQPENRAELRIGLRAGAMQEDEDQLGLAHFVEHMCFNGSQNFKKNELIDYLESVGTKFGPDLNAYTSFDETVYMLQARTDDEEQLAKGLLILQDWAGGVSFESEEIDKERGVVMSEWRSRLSPEQRMQQIYFPIMYQDSRYAERLPIGKPEIIENANHEAVRRFYKDWYRPNLMAVSIVGDFDVDWMEAQIIERFSQLKNPATPRERKEYEVPKHKETLISICSDKEAAFTRIQLMYKHDNKKVKNIGDYRRQLIYNLYNRMLNARLGELGQSANPPFTFAYSGYGQDVGNLATYSGSAMTPEGGSQLGLKTLLEENKRVLVHGFLNSELERQKTELLNYAERSAKEQDKTDSRRLVMRYIYHFLDENPIPSPEQTLELYQQLLPTIKLEEVNSLPKNWITEENRVIVITGPEKEGSPLPTEDEIYSIIKDVEESEIDAYLDNVSDEPLLAKIPTAGSIVKEDVRSEVGVTELTLSNGITVVLKPTDFKNDEILMNAFSPGGSSLYNEEDYPSASEASRIIDNAGIGNFDITQLNKKLAGKSVGVSPYISELYEGMNGSSSPKDLETFFQLIHLYFTQPRKDEQAFQSFIAKQKSIYSNIMSNPNFWFSNEVSKIMYNNHPRKGMASLEDLEKINLDKAYKIYQDRFADASDFTFIFVGNFEIEPMKAYLNTYLASLPNLDRKESWKDINADLVKGKIEKTFTKGKAPSSQIRMSFHGDFEWTAENRYNLNSLIQIMRIKLRESMREDKGGVYGVRISGGASQFPKPTYQISISFNSDPNRVKELVDTALEDIEDSRINPPSEKDLTKIKETQKQGRIKSLKENRFWNGQLRSYYQNGFDPNKINLETLEKMIEGLRGEDIQKAATMFFNDQNFMQFIMNPDLEKEAN
ncbi:MAG: insulinase family protein [Bacteroidetes bacterium]|nr:insulinase family protein [Bacteroidota bacterium]